MVTVLGQVYSSTSRRAILSGGGDLDQLRWTILDFLDITLEKLTRVGHLGQGRNEGVKV